MTDKEIEQIFANSVDVQKTADRLYQLTGRRFIVEEVDKNDGDGFTAGAYDDPDKGDDDREDLESEEDGIEPSARERARRQRQLAENVRETGRQESTAKLLKGVAMMNSETLIEKINAARLGFACVKRFVEKADSDELTEQQVTDLLLGAWGAEFGKRFQAQDEEGQIARAAVMKARDASWLKPTTVLTGERALAAASQRRGEKADPLRDRIIRDKAVSSPFLSQEQLAAYADQMIEYLENMARRKQRPGTLERV
jgi:hypothetical protein